MNNNKNIEDLLKDKLEQQEFDIQDKWMDNMTSMLDDYNDKPKSKKGFLFILTGLVLLIGLIGMLFIVKNDKAFEKNDITATKNNQDNKITQIKKHTTTQNQNSTNQITSNDKDCIAETQVANSPIINEVNIIEEHQKHTVNSKAKVNPAKQEPTTTNNKLKTSKKQTSYKQNKNNKVKIEIKQPANQVVLKNHESKQVKRSKGNTLTKSSKLIPNTNSTLIQKSNKITEDKNQLAQNTLALNETENELITEASKKALITEKNTIKTLPAVAIENTIQKKKLEVIEENSNKIKADNDSQISKNQNNSEISVSEDSIIEENILELKEDSLINKEDEIVAQKKKKDLGLSVSVTAGVSFLFRNFDSENRKRVQEESNKISWNAQLAFYKTFKNRLILGTGINLTNYGEKVNYLAENMSIKDTLTKVTVHNYINLYLKRIQGNYSFDSTFFTQLDTTRTYTDSTYLNEEVIKENGSTNFTYIEIPVKIGYKIIDSKKFSLNAMTGISFGFLLQNKGYYTDSDNNLQAAESQKVLFNYLLSADFIYKINKNINLTISPHFKYNLNNLSSLSATKRKYSSFGINGGVILDF